MDIKKEIRIFVSSVLVVALVAQGDVRHSTTREDVMPLWKTRGASIRRKSILQPFKSSSDASHTLALAFLSHTHACTHAQCVNLMQYLWCTIFISFHNDYFGCSFSAVAMAVHMSWGRSGSMAAQTMLFCIAPNTYTFTVAIFTVVPCYIFQKQYQLCIVHSFVHVLVHSSNLIVYSTPFPIRRFHVMSLLRPNGVDGVKRAYQTIYTARSIESMCCTVVASIELAPFH